MSTMTITELRAEVGRLLGLPEGSPSVSVVKRWIRRGVPAAGGGRVVLPARRVCCPGRSGYLYMVECADLMRFLSALKASPGNARGRPLLGVEGGAA